ncbi:hypothetical protein ACE10Z_23795 [Bradyrhizobium sp. Pha-3]|uniref:hypothetical protein n=1 Tax=Bradyrhizobium sp. Pha-3 TaxID=208375 RepID=UPI0035D43D79
MTKRIYIAADRVTVSKPGYDAENPPAVDYKYLSLDSRLNQGRPLEVGLFPSTVFGSGKVFYSTTYPHPPAVDIVAYSIPSAGVALYSKAMVCRDANSSIAYQRSSWVPVLYTDGFLISDDWRYRRSRIMGTGVNLYYIAWQVW